MNIRLRKTVTGWVPADPESVEYHAKLKLGSVQHGDFKNERNYKFHCKWFALITIAFDAWSELCEPMQYKEEPVMPNFDRFRKDVTIMCGHYKPVYNVRGEVRLEADSISFGSMTEETFVALFNKTIDVILHKILPKGTFTEAELRSLSEVVLEFA